MDDELLRQIGEEFSKRSKPTKKEEPLVELLPVEPKQIEIAEDAIEGFKAYDELIRDGKKASIIVLGESTDNRITCLQVIVDIGEEVIIVPEGSTIVGTGDYEGLDDPNGLKRMNEYLSAFPGNIYLAQLFPEYAPYEQIPIEDTLQNVRIYQRYGTNTPVVAMSQVTLP